MQTTLPLQPSLFDALDHNSGESSGPDSLWKSELRGALRSAEDLVRAGLIGEEEKGAYEILLSRYRFLLPRYYAGLIDRGNPLCPIRLQAVPSLKELDSSEGLADPLHDLKHQPVVNVTHRYDNRVLLHLTPNCSMYCRYCFRKSLLNELSTEMFDSRFEKAVAYVEENQKVEEVIFSGGDPFLASHSVLNHVLQRLKKAEHIRRLRFHTRVPVTLPMRVTAAFATLLSQAGKSVVVVTHFNHPREITEASTQAVNLLKAQRFTLLNQSVLLKGVNDSAVTLKNLSEKLFEIGILPYYLHHPDRAKGTFHFDSEMERGLEIYKALRESTSGYLVPRYVVDIVGEAYKVDVETFRRTT